MDALLGTMSDQDLAAKLGCKRALVAGRRFLLRIPKYIEAIVPAKEVEWTPAMDALLGTMPDPDLAAKMGCALTKVRTRRYQLGVSGYRQIITPAPTSEFEWTPAMVSLLGTMSDRALAEKIGCAVTTVRDRRHLAGIPDYRRRNTFESRFEWTPTMDALLGTMSDTDLAAKLGCSVNAVNTRRYLLGVSGFRQTRTSSYMFAWTPENDALLGTMGDRQLSEKLGVPLITVGNRRKLLGIEAKVVADYNLCWRPEIDALLGTIPDSEIAKQIGRSQRSVAKRRRLLNIAPHEIRGRILVHLTPDQEALLGTAPDRKLAAQWEISIGVVRARRIQKNIPAYKKPNLWTPQLVALLGTMSDAELALKMGLDTQSVRVHRWALRVPMANSVVWTSAMDALLGTMGDMRLAHKLGLSINIVRTRRKELKIQAFSTHGHQWSAETDSLLGTMSDTHVARKLGLSKNIVRTRRVMLKIKAFSTPSHQWSAETDSLLGTMPDSDLVTRLGLPLSAIRLRRIELGIAMYYETRWTPDNIALLGTMSDRKLAILLGFSRNSVTKRRKDLGIEMKD